MFTGLVETMGRIAARQPLESGVRLSIEPTGPLAELGLTLGESVSVSGVCLTVAALRDGGAGGSVSSGDVTSGSVSAGGARFEVDVSVETLARTTLGGWDVGTRVNLERALVASARLGGHLVTGHVDGVGEVVTVDPHGDMTGIGLSLPPDLARYVARKGSLSVDGVSLTVNEVVDGDGGCRVELMIIPHTREQTTLGGLARGQRVNLEIDLVARYIERLLPR